MSYTLDYFDGNTGDRETYETKDEAIKAAESYWNHLTHTEKADHGSEHGGWCTVYEGDDEAAVVWLRDPDTEARGWTFGDCLVWVDDSRIRVYMDRDGEHRVQIVPGSSLDEDIVALNMGSSPVGDCWEDGNGNLVCWENAQPCDADGNPLDRIIIALGENLAALIVPEVEGDVWGAIEDYDRLHGTDLWGMLTEENILGVNLQEYANVPALGDVSETIYRGARARKIVETAKDTEQWDNDGQNDDEWFAVQKGITSEGWPFRVRYGFPIGFEPDGDAECLDHILDVVVLGPLESEEGLSEITADMKITNTGNSLILKVTEQARILGLDRGDVVNVTIRRKS